MRRRLKCYSSGPRLWPVMRGMATSEPAFDTPRGHFDYEKGDHPGKDNAKGWPHFFVAPHGRLTGHLRRMKMGLARQVGELAFFYCTLLMMSDFSWYREPEV